MRLQKNKSWNTNDTRFPLKQIAIGIGLLILVAAAGLLFFARPTVQSPTLTGCESIDRNEYGVSPAIFDELPPPNKCVLSAVKAFESGSFTDAFFFSPSDYLQPEFYGNFEGEGIKYWTSPSAHHYGAVGFGAFPQEKLLTLSPGESTRVRVFLHAGYGIRTTQGMSIQPQYGHPLDADRVSVELEEEIRNGFVLGPSFPKFSNSWARPIDAMVSVAPTSPPGTITISFTTHPPSNQMEASFRSEHAFYFNATDYIGSQIPFQFKVQVLPKK